MTHVRIPPRFYDYRRIRGLPVPVATTYNGGYFMAHNDPLIAALVDHAQSYLDGRVETPPRAIVMAATAMIKSLKIAGVI